MARRKRTYLSHKKMLERGRISQKSDSRIICPKTGRAKFLYPTLKKALKACEYSDDPQRPYYCKACCGFHTTSETKKEYYKKIGPIVKKRFDMDIIETEKEFKLISKKGKHKK